jgi:hypothetical protein
MGGAGSRKVRSANRREPGHQHKPVSLCPAYSFSGRISTLRNSIGWLSDWSEIVPP